MAAFGSVLGARAQTAQELARSVVQAQAYVSLQPVPRGRSFDVAVVADIKPTYHINAHKVLDPYLIPTEVATHLPAGFRLISTEYPSGESRHFQFSASKLAVYSGRAIFRLKVEVDAAAPLGALQLPLALEYQACNNTMCLPPVKLPVSALVTVAKASAHAKFVHPDIFQR